MELHITPPEGILRELEEIDAYLETPHSEELGAVTEYGQQAAVYIARTGKLLADARHHLNSRMREAVFQTLERQARTAGATAKATNKIVDSLCADEQYLCDMAERVNRAAVHRLDWCRTLISKAKEEMRLAGMQPT